MRTVVGDFCSFQLAIGLQNHSQFPVGRGIAWIRHNGRVGVANLRANRRRELLNGRLRQKGKIALLSRESEMISGKKEDRQTQGAESPFGLSGRTFTR